MSRKLITWGEPGPWTHSALVVGTIRGLPESADVSITIYTSFGVECEWDLAMGLTGWWGVDDKPTNREEAETLAEEWAEQILACARALHRLQARRARVAALRAQPGQEK